MTEKQSTKLKIFLFFAVLIIAVVAVILYGKPLFELLSDTERIHSYIEEAGPRGPLVYILLQIAQVLIAPIPGQLIGFAGGYLFGTVWGTIYTMIGAAIGFTIIFVFARMLGRPFVEYFIGKKILEKFDYLIGNNGPFIFFLIFLLPAFPDDAICYIAGLTKIRIRTLILISLAGRLPGYLVLSFTGSGVAESKIQMTVIIFTAMMIISALAIWQHKKIETFVKGFIK